MHAVATTAVQLYVINGAQKIWIRYASKYNAPRHGQDDI